MIGPFERKCQERWPSWFKGLDESPARSCLAFGFETPEAWNDLLWQLFEDLEKLEGLERFQFTQIKSKFAGARLYCTGATQEAYDLISAAEKKSSSICEYCGSPSKIRDRRGWLWALCDSCFEAKG